MKRIYILRHGQTENNINCIIQGRIDSPLTEVGIQESINAGKFIRDNNISFDHIYCSPIKRAVDTLKYALGDDVEYETDDRVIEQDFGSAEGKSFANVPISKEINFVKDMFGGENESEVQVRMLDAMNDYVSRPDHENVLIVSHGCAALSVFRKYDPEWTKMKKRDLLPNCCIMVFEYDGNDFDLVEVLNQ